MNARRKRGAWPASTGARRQKTDCRSITFWSAIGKTDFGPFKVNAELVTLAGWGCKKCRRPVRKLAQVIPGLIPRMILHACQCVTVSTWEDEAQPTPRTWRLTLRLARAAKADVVCFNGGRESPDFQGVN